MAILYPSLAEIEANEREIPEESELVLLKYLKDNLDNSYEIYFQPHINMIHPDIIILRRGYGAFIIEVKDWNLNFYESVFRNISDTPNSPRVFAGFRSRNNNYLVNPLAQANGYREEMADICVPLQINRIIDGSNPKRVIHSGVLFYNSTYPKLKSLFNFDNGYGGVNVYDSQGYYSEVYVWSGCKFVLDRVKQRLSQVVTKKVTINNGEVEVNVFSDEVYNYLHNFLQPSFELMEQSKPLPKLTNDQKDLATSKSKPSQKIAGVAGSGKTLVLAHRAVNAYNRTYGKRVLIITYNITLTHYIYDKLAQRTRDMGARLRKDSFYVTHFQGLLKSMLRPLDEHIGFDENWTSNAIQCISDNQDILYNQLGFEKYNAIFIDEVQDIKKEWLDFIKSVLLAEGGEYVLFADEKQDIYENTKKECEEANRPKTNIPGRWNTQLKTSYRMSEKITGIVSSFTQQFYDKTYENRIIEYKKFENDPREKFLSIYRYYNRTSQICEPEDIFEIVDSFRNENGISPNDIAILSFDHIHIRELSAVFEKNNLSTMTTSETESEYRRLLARYSFTNNSDEEFEEEDSNDNDWIEEESETEDNSVTNNLTREQTVDIINKKLSEIRKRKKSQFYMNPGCVKISTVASFKGWEIPTVVLLLTPDTPKKLINVASVYTAISRAKQNLVILDYGGTPFSDFFSKVQ